MAETTNITSPSRRAVITGATTLAAASAVNVAAITTTRPAESDPYANLAAEWREITVSIDAEWRQYKEWSAETDRLFPPPETLRALPSDKDFGFDDPTPVGSEHYISAYQLSGDMSHPLHVANRNGEIRVSPGRPWPEKQARATELLECITEWQAKREAHMKALGYVIETDDEETDERSDRLSDIEAEIHDAPVATLADAITKAKLIAEIAIWYDHQHGYQLRLGDRVGQRGNGRVVNLPLDVGQPVAPLVRFIFVRLDDVAQGFHVRIALRLPFGDAFQ